VTRQLTIESFAYSERFKSEFQKLKPDVQTAVREALETLKSNPEAKVLRLHPLTGLSKPMVWKIDVFANHSWQVTFELNDKTAELKRVATHKSIDRSPR
jgi:prephenate dehydrogenase